MGAPFHRLTPIIHINAPKRCRNILHGLIRVVKLRAAIFRCPGAQPMEVE